MYNTNESPSCIYCRVDSLFLHLRAFYYFDNLSVLFGKTSSANAVGCVILCEIARTIHILIDKAFLTINGYDNVEVIRIHVSIPRFKMLAYNITVIGSNLINQYQSTTMPSEARQRLYNGKIVRA